MLLCKNETGYKNLIKLSSIAFVDGFYYRPRIDYNLLEKHCEGLVCLSACLAGDIPQLLLMNRYDEARRLAKRLQGMFGDDFYIDLLFYNLNLRCYVVIELKTGDFKPEYAGQLNFYLSAVDGILKKEQDNPSIGLLLCKSKNNVVAEYSLKDISKPIGVSEYKITSSLPDDLEKQLPSVEDIQKRIK